MKSFNNLLLNRLGVFNNWFNIPTQGFLVFKYTFFNFKNINRIIYILFKTGVIFQNHLFILYYFKFKLIQKSLPIFLSKKTFFKFYRYKIIKFKHFKQTKMLFFQKNLENSLLPFLQVFKYSDWFIIFWYQYVIKNVLNFFFKFNQTFLSYRSYFIYLFIIKVIFIFWLNLIIVFLIFIGLIFTNYLWILKRNT